MLKRKGIDRVCCVVLALTLLLAGVYTGAAASGLIQGRGTTGYAQRLFDTSYVHTLDIVIDDWDAFLATSAAEEYTACTLVIDGEKFGSVGIRGKGNTSLSSVAQYGNDRYSFKVEFDQYQKGRSYYGLDKLSLNNLIQDKTYLKDYVSYILMNKMGVPAPLCSFVQINVNGEPWGLYLAVEAVEDGFMARNFGTTDGDLYKPDSLSMGGGRGNGREFDMSEFQENFQSMFNKQSEDAADESGEDGDAAQASDQSAFQGMPGGFDFGDMPKMPEGFDPGDMPEMPGGFDFGAMPEGFDPNAAGETAEDGDDGEASEGGEEETSAAAAWRSRSPGAMGGFGGFGGFGSDDVKLVYTDDEASSYSNIFENAKTDVTEADQARLIAALKALNEGEDIESCVDAEEVIRYLVVHSFLVNGDSYTGSMIHN